MKTVPQDCKVATCRWTWRAPLGEAPECPRCKRVAAKAVEGEQHGEDPA